MLSPAPRRIHCPPTPPAGQSGESFRAARGRKATQHTSTRQVQQAEEVREVKACAACGPLPDCTAPAPLLCRAPATKPSAARWSHWALCQIRSASRSLNPYPSGAPESRSRWHPVPQPASRLSLACPCSQHQTDVNQSIRNLIETVATQAHECARQSIELATNQTPLFPFGQAAHRILFSTGTDDDDSDT